MGSGLVDSDAVCSGALASGAVARGLMCSDSLCGGVVGSGSVVSHAVVQFAVLWWSSVPWAVVQWVVGSGSVTRCAVLGWGGMKQGEQVEIVAKYGSAFSNSSCLSTMEGKRKEEGDAVFEQRENP